MGATTKQVAERANVSYRQIDHWVKKGWIKTQNHIWGTGDHREFSMQEETIVMTMAELIDIGFKADKAAELARRLVVNHETIYSRTRLVKIG